MTHYVTPGSSKVGEIIAERERGRGRGCSPGIQAHETRKPFDRLRAGGEWGFGGSAPSFRTRPCGDPESMDSRFRGNDGERAR